MVLFSCRPDHLSCHVKHVHSSERPFKCQVTVSAIAVHSVIIDFVVLLHWTLTLSSVPLQACTSAFATKDRLRSHMIRHEGKVTCSICGKMLSAAYITSHLKTHGQTNFNSCNKGMVHISQSAPYWEWFVQSEFLENHNSNKATYAYCVFGYMAQVSFSWF